MGLCYSLPNQSLEKATLDTRPEFSLKGVNTFGKILRVYDGDTAWVSVNSPIATTWRVRLLGIDTEEMRQPKDAENREEDQSGICSQEPSGSAHDRRSRGSGLSTQV